MAAPRPRASSRIDAVLVAILLGSLAPKLGLATWAESLIPRNDEHSYVVMARTITEGRAPGAFRPPGYPAFLASVRVAGGELGTARLVQALLSVASMLFVYSLARGAGGVGSARLAAGLFAFDPVLVGFSHLLWTETLYIFLWLAGLVVLVGRFDFARRGRWLAAGALFGLAAYVRPQLLSFLPFLLLWMAWRVRAEPRAGPVVIAAALLVGACAAVLLPWSVHQLATRGRLVLVTTNGPFNLLAGMDPSAVFVDKDDHWNAEWGQIPGGPYEQSTALKLGWLRIASHPGLFARKSLWEAAHLWTLDSFVLRHLRNGWYGDGLPAPVLPTAVVVTGAFSALLFSAGFLGLVLQPPSPFRAVAGLTLLHALLLFGATYSLSRYAVPLRPLLAIGAAWLATHPRAGRERLAGSRARIALVAAGLALLAFSWWNDAPLLWDMLSNGGREFRFRWLD